MEGDSEMTDLAVGFPFLCVIKQMSGLNDASISIVIIVIYVLDVMEKTM